jgi:hypothetical protein
LSNKKGLSTAKPYFETTIRADGASRVLVETRAISSDLRSIGQCSVSAVHLTVRGKSVPELSVPEPVVSIIID